MTKSLGGTHKLHAFLLKYTSIPYTSILLKLIFRGEHGAPQSTTSYVLATALPAVVEASKCGIQNYNSG